MLLILSSVLLFVCVCLLPNSSCASRTAQLPVRAQYAALFSNVFDKVPRTDTVSDLFP
jgi:hypothetical protein